MREYCSRPCFYLCVCIVGQLIYINLFFFQSDACLGLLRFEADKGDVLGLAVRAVIAHELNFYASQPIRHLFDCLSAACALNHLFRSLSFFVVMLHRLSMANVAICEHDRGRCEIEYIKIVFVLLAGVANRAISA